MKRALLVTVACALFAVSCGGGPSGPNATQIEIFRQRMLDTFDAPTVHGPDFDAVVDDAWDDCQSDDLRDREVAAEVGKVSTIFRIGIQVFCPERLDELVDPGPTPN